MNAFYQGLRIGRVSVVIWALIVLPLAARADVTFSGTGDEQSLTVIRMTVTPAAEPVPALRHRLVAREIDLQPGNAAPYYYRAMLLLPRGPWGTEKWAKEKFGDDFDRWWEIGGDAVPIADLPLDKVREALQSIDDVVGQLRVATLRRDCDWDLGVEQLPGNEYIAFMLPEIQVSRALARIDILRARLAIAEGRYEDALDAMRMNYRLARDISRAPLLVSSLVGIAEASITNGTVIELIAAPNSPNLYWALAELPNPLVSTRDAIREEMDSASRFLPFLRNAETTDHSPKEWNRLFTQAVREMSQAVDGGPVFNEFGAGLGATGLALVGYPYAKEQLVAQGMDRERVEAMAVGQVMAVYTERNSRRLADQFEKLWYLPFREMRARSEAIEQELRAAHPLGGGANREVLPVLSLLLPSTLATRTTEVRLQRNIAALEVIEALRMYAAGHNGLLPSSLDDVHEVPVPLNPATGQPFQYRLDGQTAVLTVPVSDGIPYYPHRYEITIAQQPTE